MSYRCGVCREIVARGQSRRVWNVYRTVKNSDPRGPEFVRQTAAEVPVCEDCLITLNRGGDLNQLRRVHGDARPAAAARTLQAPGMTAPARVTLLPETSRAPTPKRVF